MRLFCVPIPLLKLQYSDVVTSESGQVMVLYWWFLLAPRLKVQCVGFSAVTDFKLAEYQSPHLKLSIELVKFVHSGLLQTSANATGKFCRHKNKLFSVDANFSFCAMKHN